MHSHLQKYTYDDLIEQSRNYYKKCYAAAGWYPFQEEKLMSALRRHDTNDTIRYVTKMAKMLNDYGETSQAIDYLAIVRQSPLAQQSFGFFHKNCLNKINQCEDEIRQKAQVIYGVRI